jgi:1,4-dihydroxy-2-naphthoate octaprenyltransferase
MFGAWSSFFVEWIGIVLAGLTIKLMDDWLDVEYDQCVGRHTLATRLGRACLPYALFGFGFAVALAPDVALALFLAAYAIGMGHDLKEIMPTRLPGWAESIIALCLSAWAASIGLTVWALFVMATIQQLDDLMDLQHDRRSGQNNLANRFGFVEVTLAMFICLLAAVLFSPLKTVEVLLATPFVHMVMALFGGIGIRKKGGEP